MFQRPRTFQTECFWSLKLISATFFPSRANTDFHMTDPQSPGNCCEAPTKERSIVQSIQVCARLAVCLSWKTVQPEICKKRSSPCANSLCLVTFFQAYVWTNKHLASTQPWPLLQAAMLQSSAVTVPANTGTSSERQCLLSAADAEWRGLAKDTEERRVATWTWIPIKYTIHLWQCLNSSYWSLFFFPERALSLQIRHGFSGLLEEDILPGSQPDSFTSVWGREGKFLSVSELVLHAQVQLKLYQDSPSFLGDLPDPHWEKEFP